jgi:hypothetical protein
MTMMNNEMIAADARRVRKPKIPKKKYSRRPRRKVTNHTRFDGAKEIVFEVEPATEL